MKRKVSTIRGAQTARRSTLSSLPPDYFEQLRRDAVNVTRVNNVDVVTTAQGDTYAYCHMPYFFPFSGFLSPDLPRIPAPVQGPFEGAAAIHLAMMHLNTGDGSVVPEVEGLNETCNIRFTFEILDTEHHEATAVNRLIDVLNREPGEESPPEPLPCAILGAGRSASTIPMAIFSGVSGYPQMSGTSTSSQLDDRSQYKLFSRLIPSDDGTAIPVILYLRDVVKTDHLAVVHGSNPYANAYLGSIQKAATQYAPTMNIQSIDIPLNIITDHDIAIAVAFLKKTQFRYIFAIISGPGTYERLLTEAYSQGIAGDEYVWMFTDTLGVETITEREYEDRDSPLAVAARGSSAFFVQPGIPGTAAYETFFSSVQDFQNHPSHIDFLQSKLPVYEGEPDFEPLQVERIFRYPDLGINAVFLYDATIAMGLAACSVADPITYFDGPTHYNGIINSSFFGTSGRIAIDPTTGSRDPSSAYFQLINFVEQIDPTTGKISFETVHTDLFRDGVWESITPYTYGDGTSNIPSSLPEAHVDFNYINASLRGTGFALSALTIILAIVFAGWTIRYKTCKVVVASQPIFLLFIAGGVLLMGSAIIPLGIDDKIASQRGCDIACRTTPWLAVLGFALAFAALFSKTWRINRIFHNASLKRVKVTAFDVMTPLISLLVVDILILALWTGLDPLTWEREITRVDVFGQTLETKGRCESGSFAVFVSVLGVVNLGVLVVAAFQAYQARKIAVEFSESSYVGRAIGLFLLACLYGIPVLAITWEDPSARYFVLMILAFVCSNSVLLLIFIPKVIYHRRGGFKKASHIINKHVRSSSERDTSTTDASGTFVSGLSRENSTGDRGIRVVDRPSIRDALKDENRQLLKQQKELKERLKLVEELEKPPTEVSRGTVEVAESSSK